MGPMARGGSRGSTFSADLGPIISVTLHSMPYCVLMGAR